MLDVRGLCKSYGDVPALRGVDLQVAEGEIVGLLGPNGAGKSTLVSIVAGLRRADAGTVFVAGADPTKPATRRQIGLAPQELGIYPSLTVRENLALFADMASLRGRARSVRIDEVASLLSLSQLLDRPCQFLSGGEKRRVHTAMALVHRPRLLLLDEPTTGVDVATRTDLLAAVRGLAADGAAVCYSTHYLPEVEALGASVAIIDRGRMVARGTLAELVAQHANASIELRFDGTAPRVPSGWSGSSEGSVLRLRTESLAADAAAVLGALGADAARLQAVELVRPSLESVFLTLTGRRFTADDAGAYPERGTVPSPTAPAAEEVRDVLAP
ncbi:MAG: ABC transporter ATP-binding protein [Solirubrobacteraceae bacterium]